MGTTSLIFGIISLVMLLLVIIRVFSFGAIPTILAIIGLIMGIKDIISKKNNNEDYRQSVIGVILCSIYLIIFIITIITSVSSMNQILNNH